MPNSDQDLEEPVDKIAYDIRFVGYMVSNLFSGSRSEDRSYGLENTSSKSRKFEQAQGGEMEMSTDGDDYNDVPEGVNEELTEAYEEANDALHEARDTLGLSQESLEQVRETFYDSVDDAVQELADERDQYEEELEDKLYDFADYVRNDLENRRQLAQSLDNFETELQEFADNVELHGDVPQERARRTSQLVDDITGREDDAETDGGWFNIL